LKLFCETFRHKDWR